MRRLNELVESLSGDVKSRFAARMKKSPKEYKKLMQQLLVQGLIKLIEPTVTLRCRKSDQKVLESVIEDAVAEYKQLMLSQVKALKEKDDIPCRVSIDETSYLPEYNEDDSAHSCLGGFVLLAKKNRIVCSQTLDDRLDMLYHQAIPAIRATLFPSLTKPSKNEADKKAGL